MPRKTQPSVKKIKSAPSEKLSASVVNVAGKVKGRIQLPKELFGVKVNKQLLAQAVRVYLANQRVGGASTKTRGEVEGSTRKIYRQKGTGRARHGAIRAPIFVGGGIVFGPKPRDFGLKMPAKMKKAALASALTSQLVGNNIIVVDGLETLAPKTKLFADVFHKIGATKKTLFLIPNDAKMLARATRNLSNVDVLSAVNVHPYTVLSHEKIVFTKDALTHLSKKFVQ
ncbi:50S ribosomal protein L4 [Candidatus Gottesmanbacteria bacterium]|nr:50S ribosomal protein L4 [Candidatus Gottesmanbacteria bacterium]